MSKDEKTIDPIRVELDNIWAFIRRIKNELETLFECDFDGDGKVGAVSIRSVLATMAMCVLGTFAFGETVLWQLHDSDAVHGTTKVVSDDAGTATLTVDAIAGDVTGDIAGDVTGDITTDDINASGADSASLDVNVPASTNAQMGTITVKSATAVASLDDADYIEYNLLNMYNSATAVVDYAYMRAVADDVTTATEDGALEFYVEINSTATKVLDLDASGATVTALSTGTGEATIDGKYAVVGGDASTGLMIQKGAITSTATGPQTNSFATVFGAAPTVVCTYTEDPGDVQPLYVTGVTESNFICTVTADKNFAYIAVGARP